MTGPLLFRLAWAAWALSWLAATPWSARSRKRVVSGGTTLSRLLIGTGAFLLLSDTSSWVPGEPLWHVEDRAGPPLAALTVPGFLFAWWGRIHLGRLWSGAITRKEGHRLVDTGPYAMTRHPIYTGLIAAALVTAFGEATLPALAGSASIALGLWLKAALEERFLRQELGPELYDAYRRRVPMLVPFWPTGGGR